MSTDLRQLSERELETLRLVATGLSNQQIANELGVSINTVKVHLRNIFAKIGVTSRTEATVYAVRAGIVTIDRHENVIETGPTEEAEASSSSATSLDMPMIEPTVEVAPEVTREPEAVSDRQVVASLEQAPAALPLPSASPGWKSRRWMLILALVGAGLAIVMLLSIVSVRLIGNVSQAPMSLNEADLVSDRARWRKLADAKTPRAGFAMISSGDLIYVVGGENQAGVLKSIERYDSQYESWTTLSDKPTPVADVRAVAVSGRIYVPGGRRSGDPKDISDVFERYDPRTETWEQLPKLPQPRSGYALAALEGKIYLFGGWDGAFFRREVWQYDPDKGSWTEQAPMPTSRAFADANVIDGRIYVLGGENETGLLAANEVYRPDQEDAEQWSRLAPMPQPRSRFGSAVALSVLHIVGGTAADATPLKYNTRTDSW